MNQIAATSSTLAVRWSGKPWVCNQGVRLAYEEPSPLRLSAHGVWFVPYPYSHCRHPVQPGQEITLRIGGPWDVDAAGTNCDGCLSINRVLPVANKTGEAMLIVSSITMASSKAVVGKESVR